MNKKKVFISGGILTAFVACVQVLAAQAPVVNIGSRHGMLRQAQESIVQAYEKIEKAQSNNDYELGGHAQKAKDLLLEADRELRKAANTANSEGR